MSTQPDMLEHALAGDIFEKEFAEPQTPFTREAMPWNPDRFGEEQIRSLVRQIFLPGWPKPARQVVFCAVEDGDVAEVCLRVSQTLAAQIPGNVALVETHLPSTGRDEEYGTPTVFRPSGFRPLRDAARRAPYMHDGSVATLEAVIELYDRGGADRPSRSELIKPLGLTTQEKADLRAFLDTLTEDPAPFAQPILPR